VTFRIKLLLAMMLLVSGITVLGVYVVQRQLASSVERSLKRQFQSEIAALYHVHEIRHAALAELCHDLAQKPRLHAALEDNALDLLYPTAKDELHDIMSEQKDDTFNAHPFHATFYRFLDGNGAIIGPPNDTDAGELNASEERQLRLTSLPKQTQIGYLVRRTSSMNERVDEVIAMPIISTETNEPIAAIVVGFKSSEVTAQNSASGIISGIWLNDRLHLPASVKPSATLSDEALSETIKHSGETEQSFTIGADSGQRLVFYKRLNPNSLFPAAYEVSIYPLNDLFARQQRARWRIGGVGAIVLMAAFVVSHLAAAHLSVPVSKLASDSAADRAQRERAEAELEKTSLELQRSARFSANTSHQLKTPITVLRAGLEELQSRKNLSREVREELSALIHQTFRVTSIIEDLLLLSQMDAGRLQITLDPVCLTQLIEAQLDDLSALPDGAELEVKSDCSHIRVAGDQHYLSLVLQNLLENARKYNRPSGRIHISCHEDGDWAVLRIGNTGQTIPIASQEHIFERFHRGLAGESITGHGLGLNLARELVRLHQGELRLVRSEDDWTEFEIRLRLAEQNAIASAQVG
jgi:signal transduction histidine kinase